MRHRAIQRTLFRMQHDSGYAAAVLRGDRAAVAHLEAEEAALLGRLDLAGVTADFEGRRKAQTLGNAMKEILLSASLADRRGASLGAGFLSSEAFHRAVQEGGRIPLALVEHARRRARSLGLADVEALLELEAAMAEARRTEGRAARPAPGEVQLAADRRLVLLPNGVVDFAAKLRAALDRKKPPPRFEAAGEERAWALLQVRARPSRFALPEVSVEELSETVAALLLRARDPLGPAARAALAGELGADLADLEDFVSSLVEDGVLLRG